ncbi:MAG TPA: helix-turn-helix transcriptional regulator [Pirellulales bacterium]|nr:helix-turn-helix transcriptional regulator [Pirellulales bacterium]
MQKTQHTAEYAALCKELRAARDHASISQRELAKRLKVPHSWVAKVEIGERRIDLVEFCHFMAACGLDPTVVSTRLIRRLVKPSATTIGGGRKP